MCGRKGGDTVPIIFDDQEEVLAHSNSTELQLEVKGVNSKSRPLEYCTSKWENAILFEINSWAEIN
jgi:hypothetical protein